MHVFYLCALALKTFTTILKTFSKSVQHLTIEVNLMAKLFLFRKVKFLNFSIHFYLPRVKSLLIHPEIAKTLKYILTD